MVLIGPIIIAVVLMALLVLGVSGIRWKLPVRTASRRAGPGPPPPAGRHRECSFRDPGRAASAASQLRPRAQPARRG